MKKMEPLTDETKLAVITTTIARMSDDMKEMRNDLKDLKGVYPTKEEVQAKIDAIDKKYELARSLIYGMCGLILIGVIGGLLTMVINK